MIHAKGIVTLLLQLERKPTFMRPLETRTDSPGETPDVPQDPCQHWRGILRFWHLLGASVRNPARDKVMRKEADIRKACSDFRDPSANS